ncbi:MAG: prolipoprotein diacylglyceryl transferase family protein [Janthinobacterium lividum]
MAFVYAPPSPLGHPYYAVCQLAAFAVFVGLLLAQGQRRGYPWRNWLPLVAAATLALVLGCQLVFLPPGAWLNWLRGDAAIRQVIAEGPRSIVGGAAASLLAVLALRRVLGFRGWAVLDAFAGPLCWALAVQCVGCLLAGCCWGEATASGWGLRYGPGTPAYAAQLAQGLVPNGAGHTLPVVPTQLYHLLLCVGTGLALLAVRRRAAAWPGGSRYLLAMSLLCLGRFGVEFWRDPAGEPLLGTPLTLAGCSLLGLQWLLLLEATTLLAGWAWLVRQAGQAAPAPALVAPVVAAPALVALGLLAATALLAQTTFTLPEALLLKTLFLSVLLTEGYAWLGTLSYRLPRLAGLPLGVLLAAVVLGSTAQTPAPQADGTPTKTVIFSGGILGNQHDEDSQVYQAGSCNDFGGGGHTNYLNLYHRSLAGGSEIKVEQTQPTGKLTEYGGGLWLGRQQIGAHYPGNPPAPFSINPDTTVSFRRADVHLFFGQRLGHDWLSVRYRLGLHMGSLGAYNYYQNQQTDKETNVAPELMLALGNPRLLYLQTDLNYGAENAFTAATSRIGLGSGLGQLTGSNVLLGYASSAHYPAPSMGFVSANLRLPTSTGLNALSLEPYFATDFARHQLYSLKVNYRLGGK